MRWQQCWQPAGNEQVRDSPVPIHRFEFGYGGRRILMIVKGKGLVEVKQETTRVQIYAEGFQPNQNGF